VFVSAVFSSVVIVKMLRRTVHKSPSDYSPQFTRLRNVRSTTPNSGARLTASRTLTPKFKKLFLRKGSESFGKVQAKVFDKERLYEEVLALKQSVNLLRLENTRLKTKTAQLERELSRRDSLLNDIKSSNALPTGLTATSNLKSKVKELKEQLRLKGLENSLMKKQMQTTRIEEMETELKVYSDECTRLKQRLTEVIERPADADCALLISSMREDRQALAAELADAMSEIIKWRDRVVELEQSYKKKSTEALKGKVRDLKSALDTLRKTKDEAGQMAVEAQTVFEEKLKAKQAEVDRLQTEVDRLMRCSKEQVGKVAAAAKLVRKTVKTNETLGRKLEALQQKTGFSLPEAKQLALSIVKKLEGTNQTLEDFAAKCEVGLEGLMRAVEQISVDFTDIRPVIDRVFNDLEITAERVLKWLEPFRPEPRSVGPPSESRSPLRLKLSLDLTPIKRKQVEDLLLHMSLRMQLHRLPKSKLLTVMFGESVDKEAQVSHPELIRVLSSTPFNLSAAESAQVADFLLEKHTNIVALVGFLFFELEDWDVLKPKDEEQLDNEIMQLLRPIALDFKEACEAHDAEQSGTISVEVFMEILEEFRLEVSEKQMKYLGLLFYSHNLDFETVPYQQLLQAYAANDSVSEASDSTQLVNSCLEFLAKALHSNDKSPSQVFKADAKGLVRPEEFYHGLQKLGFPDIERKDFHAILGALNLDSKDELCIQLDYLSDLLTHYALN
jgi:hypothetical protein